MSQPPAVSALDPFDLPDWLGGGETVWRATSSVRGGHLVRGELTGDGETLECDLLGADQAYPLPVLADEDRRACHQAWTHGQVLLVSYDGRLTLTVPGTGFTADLVMEAVGRLAKAVGAKPASFAVMLRL